MMAKSPRIRDDEWIEIALVLENLADTIRSCVQDEMFPTLAILRPDLPGAWVREVIARAVLPEVQGSLQARGDLQYVGADRSEQALCGCEACEQARAAQ